MSRATPSGRTRVAAAGKTDVGRRRKHNEDSILLRPELQLFIVADGMGGHNAGEVASALAARSVENFFAATATDGLPPESEGVDEHLSVDARRLVGAVRKANSDVFEIASTRRQHAGMGSTLVAATVSDADRRVHICHVGDSRCYRIRDDQIEQLTRDHSLINDALAMRPDLTEEILAELPKNVITRAVGTQDTLEVDLRSEELRAQDLYLLCSDGLSGLVSPEQILEVTNLTADLEELCELLVIMANEAGGPDNISVLAVRIDGLPGSGAPASAEAAGQASDEEPRPGKAEPLRVEVQDEEPEPEQDGAVEGAGAPEPEPEQDVEVALAGAPEPERESEPEAEPEPTGPAVVVGTVMSVGEPAPSEPATGPEPAAAAAPVARAADAQVVVCAVCGHELLEDNRFCVECGTRVDERSAAVVSRDDLLSPDEAIEIDMEEGAAADVAAEYALPDEPVARVAEAAAGAVEVVSSASSPAFCHLCGAKLLPDNRFCVECGARMPAS